jgi:hypothetical protein
MTGALVQAAWYATREDVKGALDIAETARSNAQIDRALGSATNSIEGLCNRRFYPEQRTMTWDWPNMQTARSWRLWLDSNELISLTSIVSGGITIPNGNVLLRPDDGPPFTRVELNLGGQSAFGSLDSYQRSITITGLYGHRNDEAPAGTLAAAVASTSVAAVTVTDASAIGVGQILRIDTERLIVTGRRSVTTGQTQQGALTANLNATVLPVVDGTTLFPGEVITLDGERMLIVDITGNNLIVKRAWDGTVLATHTGATVYAGRQLVVTRGALGSTAATHAIDAPIVKHQPPGVIRNLAIAEALNTIQQDIAGYARTPGILGSGQKVPRTASFDGLDMLRSQAFNSVGRTARMRAV